ncbi:RAF-like serine/threonine-protein kinase PRAF isoform X2 [Aristolochia californica]|uniref:RAF-like serine/threonine-protein kinase PRAF isoform X2 n=1 Tax=Aristolochia californica TaxID=171875 RepID=UPI0035D8E6F6
MAGTSMSTGDSAVAVKNSDATLKLLCSYGGKILPRYPDGKLRYMGGETRVLAVDRSIPFPDLLVKLSELYGSPVSLRCQLPMDDLDALVSITSDEDLANLIEEYDRANRDRSASLKVRAFLSQQRAKTPSPPSSARSVATAAFRPPVGVKRCVHQIVAAAPVTIGRTAVSLPSPVNPSKG